MPSNPRYANGSRRRRLRERILAEEDHCGICGEPVDVTLPAGGAWSPEIDEIIPVSRGGSPYSRANTQLAHRICNQRKSDRIPGDAAPTPTRQYITHRTW